MLPSAIRTRACFDACVDCRTMDISVGHSLHSMQFFQVVEHLAAAYVKEVDARNLPPPLPET